MLILGDVAREFCLQVIRERGGRRLNVDSEDFEQERQSHICGEKCSDHGQSKYFR